MEEEKGIKKKINIAIIIGIIIGIVCTSCIFSCNWEECGPETQCFFKLYDENGKDLDEIFEKDSKINGDDPDWRYGIYNTAYNGDARGINIVLYVDDKVLARVTYDGNDDYNAQLLQVYAYKLKESQSEGYYSDDIGDWYNVKNPIVDKGKYNMEYRLANLDSGELYKTEDGSLQLTVYEIYEMNKNFDNWLQVSQPIIIV